MQVGGYYCSGKPMKMVETKFCGASKIHAVVIIIVMKLFGIFKNPCGRKQEYIIAINFAWPKCFRNMYW